MNAAPWSYIKTALSLLTCLGVAYIDLRPAGKETRQRKTIWLQVAARQSRAETDEDPGGLEQGLIDFECAGSGIGV